MKFEVHIDRYASLEDLGLGIRDRAAGNAIVSVSHTVEMDAPMHERYSVVLVTLTGEAGS